MSEQKPRPTRQEFASRVRLVVSGKNEIIERYAHNISEGGLFVQHDAPPLPGSIVLIEFILPDGTALSRAAAKVVHARAALNPGEKTAGMGLQFIDVGDADDTARQLLAKAPKSKAAPKAPPSVQVDSRSVMAPPRLIKLKGPVVGIDLGTVNSAVAVVDNGVPRILRGNGGYDTLPSVVHVAKDGEVTVGHLARERMILDPTRGIFGGKRFLGRPFGSKEVKSLGHFFPYELVEGAQGRVAAKLGDRVLSLEEVASHILGRLKLNAQTELGTELQRCVITVPAYFGETQRQAVRDAARLAGLYVERILNEPTAAAIAYGFGRGLSETILVYDLGGGTFDVSILKISGDSFEVITSDGDPFLGGADFDDRLTEYALMTFERKQGISLRDQPVSVQRVRFAVEMAKHQLSESMNANIELPYITATDQGPIDLRMSISRDLLETLTGDLVERTLGLTQSTLDRATMKSQDLDDVVLVGGQSRSPQVRRLIFERFGRRPSTHVHPDEAVALGAALVADALDHQAPVNLAEVLPATIRVGRADGSTEPLLRRGVRLPAERRIELALPDSGQELKVFLYRGEQERADDNGLLGALTLPGGQGHAVLSVSVSADGLLSVRGRHPSRGEIGDLDVLLL